MESVSLAGRTAFITGGADGIGLGIARACARAGVKVAIADINREALEAARAELSGMTVVGAYELDVRDRDAFARVADEAEGALGPVTLLFNNAGVCDSTSPRRMDYHLWDWVMDVNLNGVYNGIQSFVPRMLERGDRGHVVNTASAAGVIVAGSGFLYHTSKFAVVGLSESLRIELENYGIGVSVLCPGQVATDIVQHTLSRRPTNAPAHSSKVSSILSTAQQNLRAQGVAPSVVGEMVLAAVQSNSLYIFTDNKYGDLIRVRTEALLDAVAETATTIT